MEEKKKHNYFKDLIIFLFILFLILYSVNKSGYYQKLNYDKTLYTERQIEEFERDIDNGEYLDYKVYVTNEKSDYSNGFSDFGAKSSELIDKWSKKGTDLLIKLFSYLFK